MAAQASRRTGVRVGYRAPRIAYRPVFSALFVVVGAGNVRGVCAQRYRRGNARWLTSGVTGQRGRGSGSRSVDKHRVIPPVAPCRVMFGAPRRSAGA